MKVIMTTEQLSSTDDLERFIGGSQKVAFAVLGDIPVINETACNS